MLATRLVESSYLVAREVFDEHVLHVFHEEVVSADPDARVLGEGDLAAWKQSLKTITELFPTFSELTGKVSGELVQLNGQLRPGYSQDEIEKRLRGGVPEG